MPISRRQFCAAIGAASLTSVQAAAQQAAEQAKVFAGDTMQQPLRVITYNVFSGTGWPNNRPLSIKAVAKGQMAKRLAMELALHDPDIINFSESPSEELVQEIAKLLEMNCARFPGGGDCPGTLLSRFEIMDSKNVPLDGQRPNELFLQHWGRATVQLPSGEPLIVHSAHLRPSAESAIRIREIKAMLASMQADLVAGRSMLLIGDLNHGPDTEEYKLWLDAGWVDTFAQVGAGEGFTFRSDIPKWRIDFVMATGPIADHIVESRPLFEGAFRLNIADKAAVALSDHLPQLAVFHSIR